MTTEAQIEANRVNAQKSTGPRTPEGKAKVAQNALKHGLRARDGVIGGEDLDEFKLFREEFAAELAPASVAESLLAARIIGLAWRLQRAERFHNQAFDVLYAQCVADPRSKQWHPAPDPGAPDPLIGLTVVRDFSQTKVMERLLVYERRIENSLYRTMAELRKVQGQRQAGGGIPATSPTGAVRDTHPADFTLDDLPAQIDAWEDKPAGVTTNTPAEPSCQTKPMGGREERQVLDCQEVTKDSPQGGAGKTPPQKAGYRMVPCVGRPATRFWRNPEGIERNSGVRLQR